MALDPYESPETRQRRALELHLAGATYDAIAKAIGYADHTGARTAVKAALAGAVSIADDEDVLHTELARLDAMLVGLWSGARRGDVAAIDRVLKISERRASLLTLAALARGQAAEAPTTPLSEFERRLHERDASAKSARRSSG